jgi:hypothetical protein
LARAAPDHAECVTIVGFSGSQKEDAATSKELSHFATTEPVQLGTNQGARSSKELSHDLATSQPSALPDSAEESQVFMQSQNSTNEVSIGTSPGATSVWSHRYCTVQGSDLSTIAVENDATLISAEVVEQDEERQLHLENAQARVLSSAPRQQSSLTKLPSRNAANDW